MTSDYFEAIHLATLAHKTQTRKVDKTPYIAHPMAVALALQLAGARKDVVLAGSLHDVLEDTDVTAKELEAKFGQEVLGLVLAVTEDKRIHDWKQRKALYIGRLKESTTDARLLSAADKLHNLSSMLGDLEHLGPDFWGHFRAPRKEQHWFYSTLLKLYHDDPGLAGSSLVDELGGLVDRVFVDESQGRGK